MGSRFKTKANSLFGKILVSFLSIILLFSIFNVAAFTFFQSNIQKEIIRYNRLILKSAADRYGTHFDRIKTLLFNYYNDENAIGFNRELLTKAGQEADFLKAREMIVRMRTDIYNPLFYLDNVILYFRSDDLTIDKEGSSSAQQLFTNTYASERYPLSFWREQFERKENFVLLPSAPFVVGSDSGQRLELLPFSFKLPASNYQTIGMIDMGKIQQSFFGEEEGRTFLILDADGRLLYSSSGERPADDVLAFGASRDYALVDGTYYFAEKDEEGLTYVTVVPYANIASQLKQFNVTLLIIFVLAVAIGIAASLFFSNRINSPVKQLISSILDRSPFKLKDNSINEFSFIHQKIDELRQEKEDVQKDLQHKKSVLTSYNYINKLKSINTEISEWKDFINTDESFTVVLYELRFRPAAFAEMQMSPDRAAYYIREHVNLVTGERFPGAHTFQVESNQILSVIGGGAPREHIRGLLTELKTVLDKDKDYCLVTVAVSSLFDHSTQFNHAYRQVTEMAQQAMLTEETQLMFQTRPLPGSFALGPTQDQELNACLQAGNDAGCIQLVERWLDEMEKKEAGVAQSRQFVETVSSKTMKMMEIFKVEPGGLWPLKPVVRQLKECCTIPEYKAAFRQLFELAGAAIRAKKEENDPIIAFVLDTLSTQYAEDISLDYLADKRNMSSAYLSVYIKEKTGVNFSDHLNHIRMQKAKELLARTDGSIQDIGRQIGYRNITSFNRMFKKWMGMTPGEYRKQALDVPEPE